MSHKKKAPDAVAAAIEGEQTETHIQEGTINMQSTETHPLSTEDRARLEAWCAEVRRQYEEANTPIRHGDSRMLEADRAQYAAMGWTPEEIGRVWAHEHVELPAWPLDVPPWAAETDVSFGGSREIVVLCTGRQHRSGDVSAWVSQVWMFNLYGGPDDGRDGPQSEPSIVHTSTENDLSEREAFDLAAVLFDAAVELGKILAGGAR